MDVLDARRVVKQEPVEPVDNMEIIRAQLAAHWLCSSTVF